MEAITSSQQAKGAFRSPFKPGPSFQIQPPPGASGHYRIIEKKQRQMLYYGTAKNSATHAGLWTMGPRLAGTTRRNRCSCGAAHHKSAAGHHYCRLSFLDTLANEA